MLLYFIGRVTAVYVPAFNLVAMLSVAIAGYLDSTVLRNFHATILGVSIGPIDTIFTGTGILIVIGGLYAMVRLRDMNLSSGVDA